MAPGTRIDVRGSRSRYFPVSHGVTYDGGVERRPCKDEVQMRAAVVIDDNLLAEARRLTGLKETAELMREALRALIERESARRLANLGGSEPDLGVVPRRRGESA